MIYTQKEEASFCCSHPDGRSGGNYFLNWPESKRDSARRRGGVLCLKGNSFYEKCLKRKNLNCKEGRE